MAHRQIRNARWFPQPQAIQAVFFDVGFTLVETSPSIPVIVRGIMERRGTPVALECLQKSYPRAETHFGELTRAAPGTWGDEAEIAQMWRRYFVELLRPCFGAKGEKALEGAAADIQVEFDQAIHYALYPDVEPTLAALRERGMKLGVVSDWGIALGMIMRQLGLTEYFDFAVISATARRAKPDPELYRLALDRADVVADYAIHVGDSYVRDVLGARALGIHPILIDRLRMLQPSVVDCPLVYDLYEVLDLLDVARPSREAAGDKLA